MALEKLWASGRIRSHGRLLHVAPEPALAARFSETFDYVSADLDGRRAMFAMDITDLRLPDALFDAVVCNHVLEHVPDDARALAELFRILKPGGWASLQVPIRGESTDEDPLLTNPVARFERFGQADHVRFYGADFAERLRRAGFDVDWLPKAELLSGRDLLRLSVACEEQVIVARKPG